MLTCVESLVVDFRIGRELVSAVGIQRSRRTRASIPKEGVLVQKEFELVARMVLLEDKVGDELAGLVSDVEAFAGLIPNLKQNPSSVQMIKAYGTT